MPDAPVAAHRSSGPGPNLPHTKCFCSQVVRSLLTPGVTSTGPGRPPTLDQPRARQCGLCDNGGWGEATAEGMGLPCGIGNRFLSSPGRDRAGKTAATRLWGPHRWARPQPDLLCVCTTRHDLLGRSDLLLRSQVFSHISHGFLERLPDKSKVVSAPQGKSKCAGPGLCLLTMIAFWKKHCCRAGSLSDLRPNLIASGNRQVCGR